MSVKKERTALDEESLRFLRRGEPSPVPRETDLAVGPSVIFDEESGRAIAVERSPPPSQMISTQQAFEGLSSSAARLPRQRPRFHTVQDLDLALNQAIEGKITSKNAWLSKEASDLLEGITHTIQNTLDASATADDYAGFAKAATVVEGCSKVWTSRVDSTHQQSNLMVQRLLRNDAGDRSGAGLDGGDGTGAGVDGEGADGGPNGEGRRRKGVHGRGAGAGSARTLALDATEINLDGKSKTALTQGGMNAQFRAITEKFDQGNAQGLLMNNAPQGMRGNLILDVDYARADGTSSAATVSGRPAAVKREAQPTSDALNEEEEGQEGNDDGEQRRQSRPGGRLSHALRHLVEEDAFMDLTESEVALPAYEPRALTMSGLLSTRNSVRLSHVHGSIDARPGPAPSRRGSGRASASDLSDAAAAAAADAVESLLMVPHTNSPLMTADGNPALLTTNSTRTSTMGPAGDALAQRLYHTNDDGDDNGDWGDADDGMAGGFDDDDEDAGTFAEANGAHPETSLAAELIMSGTDVGAAARALMSGVASMDAMDDLLGTTGTVQQLALEADDPSAWCPLSQVAPASTPQAVLNGGLTAHAELSKLRKAHRFDLSGEAGAGPAASLVGTGGLLKHAPESFAKSAAAKKQKSVVFDLPAELGHTTGSSRGGVFVLDRQEINESALKQSQTTTKNITPLGRELVLGKDAERAVLSYVQSGFQRTKAEQMNLQLPEVPQPGTTIPAYLPYPIAVSHFFQPFSTAQPEWNLLRKSASGQVLDIRSGAAVGAPGATATAGLLRGRGSGGSAGSGSGGLLASHHRLEDGGVDDRFDMPVEFFPGGAEHDEDNDMAGGGYDDGGYDAFGPDDNNDDGDEAYDPAGAALRAERFLLAQFNAQQMNAAAAAAAAGLASSGRTSSSDVSGARASYQGDLAELAKVLDAPEATIPNQVDVVQLRTSMWEALQQQMASNPLIPSSVHWMGGGGQAQDTDEEDSDSEAEEADTRMQQRDPNAPMLKRHAQRVLGDGRAPKRARTGDAIGEDDSDAYSEEDKDKDAATPVRPAQKKRAVGDDRRAKKDSHPSKHYELGLAHTSSSDDDDDDDDDEAVGDGKSSTRKMSKRDALPHFSHVVRSVLPAVPSISSTGTLSPAFFFFSILFLANEHNVVLDNVNSLDDLIVRGVAQGVSAGGH